MKVSKDQRTNEDVSRTGRPGARPGKEPVRLVSMLPIVVLSLFLLGTKECQEDYDFGSQTEISDPTGTPTPTSTPTASATPTSTPTATPTPTETEEDEGARAQARVQSSSLLSSLMELAGQGGVTPGSDKPVGQAGNRAGSGGADDRLDNPYARAAAPENWLGLGFASRIEDADGDGFCDWLEAALDADPRDRSSTPPAPPSKLRADALVDLDGDGLFDAVNRAISGETSGAEARRDTDSDGLPDYLEGRFGSDPLLLDSDKDGALDSEEFVLGIDPLNRDSDGDGILDGAEVRLGSDPAFPEAAVR